MGAYYEDDLVTLYHGSCLEVPEWAEADVLVTDPPYGVAWAAGSIGGDRSQRKAARAAGQSIVGDESTVVRDAALEMWGTKKPAMVFGSWRMPRPEAATQRLIWHKKGRFPGVNRAAFYPNDEEIYLLQTGWVGRPTGTVIATSESRAQQPQLVGHPTPKPIGLMELLIGKCPEGSIADPFAGSGATLIAARNLGRRSIGVEVEERYCEIIARRLSQQTFDFGEMT